ncbi:MAG: IPT/TIG domain-containing protein, partial [Thermoleophilia bacterium]
MKGSNVSRQHTTVLRIWLIAMAVAVITLVGAGSALATEDRWTDITDQQWIKDYGITAEQVATVASGYPDKEFKPTLAVKRGQFAKMVVDGFDLPKATPATASFKDVLPTNYYYPWVEGGFAAKVIAGFADRTYRPEATIQRQQANSILGLYLSAKETRVLGSIKGEKNDYASLAAWYSAEGKDLLKRFADANTLASVHAAPTAYLVYHQVVKGTQRPDGLYLTPVSSLTRAQAAVMILRVDAVDFATVLPTVTGLDPAGGPAVGGNIVVITGTDFVGVSAVRFGTMNATVYHVDSTTRITAVAPAGTEGSTVNVTVTTPAGTSSVAGTANDYVYGAPTITKLDPDGQPTTAAGTAVTITGTNFVTGATVAFGTVPATNVAVVDSTTITCKSPAHEVGVVDVTVTTPAGTSSVAGTANDYVYGVPATAPSNIELAAGSVNPVGGVTNVAIPDPGATDTTGKVTGWVKGAADRITFTVTDVAPATSAITINGATYLSGNDYAITSKDTLTIVVTTEEADKVTAVRTFTVPVAQAIATAPSNIELAAGSVNPVGGVTNVAIPNPGATDTNGSVTGWKAGTADRITFTVTDVAPAASTITINGAKYLSGNDYEIASTDTLT